MLSMVRAELYRMARERMVWVFVAIIAVPTAASAVAAAVVLGDGGLVSFIESTSSDASRVLDASTGQAPVLSLYGSSFVNGSFVAMVSCCYLALFAAKGVGDGKRPALAKNLVQARGGRMAYAAAQVAVAAVAGALFVVVGIASCALFYGLAGFSVLPGSFAEFALWAAQVWCCVLAYEAVTLVVALATGSDALGRCSGCSSAGSPSKGRPPSRWAPSLPRSARCRGSRERRPSSRTGRSWRSCSCSATARCAGRASTRSRAPSSQWRLLLP